MAKQEFDKLAMKMDGYFIANTEPWVETFQHPDSPVIITNISDLIQFIV